MSRARLTQKSGLFLFYVKKMWEAGGGAEEPQITTCVFRGGWIEEFQRGMKKYHAKKKSFSPEKTRQFEQGRLIPWHSGVPGTLDSKFSEA